MRKVLFKKWIPFIETKEYKESNTLERVSFPEDKKYLVGTGCYIESEGIFHGFYTTFDYAGQNNEIASYPCAIIEDKEGNVLQIGTDKFRFIDSHEDKSIDWGHLYHQYAGMAMQGLLSDPNITDYKGAVHDAVLCADTLISELKNTPEP